MNRSVLALANGHEMNVLRVVSEGETRGAPTNPIRPIIIVEPVATPSTPAPKPANQSSSVPASECAR